jgi:hypothetical protein
MVVLIPVTFMLGLVVGNSLKGSGGMAADSLSSWLSAIATVAIAVLTFVLAKETWYLREAQIQQLLELRRENIRPNIGVQLESSRAGLNFVNVKINSNSWIVRARMLPFNQMPLSRSFGGWLFFDKVCNPSGSAKSSRASYLASST